MKIFTSENKQIKFRPESFGYSVFDGRHIIRVTETFYDIFLMFYQKLTRAEIFQLFKEKYPDVPEEYFFEDIDLVIKYSKEQCWIAEEMDLSSYTFSETPIENAMTDKLYPVAPDLVDFALTYDCNLLCHHCNLRGGEPAENELSTQEIIHIIDQIYQMGAFQLTIMGGEPFIHPDFLHILEHIFQHAFMHTTIITNGTLLHQIELPDFLKNSRFSIVVSIYEDLISDLSYYTDLKNKICQLKAQGFTVKVNYLIMNSTLDKIRARYEELIETGIDGFLLIKYATVGRATLNEELTYESWAGFLREMSIGKVNGKYSKLHILVTTPWEMYLPLSNTYSIGEIEHIWGYASPLLSSHYREITPLGCNGGITSLFIGADGSTFPCGVIPRYEPAELGNVRTHSIGSIWHNSARINEFRNLTLADIPLVCQKCDFVDYCGGGCRGVALALTGDYRGFDLRCPIVQEHLQEQTANLT